MSILSFNVHVVPIFPMGLVNAFLIETQSGLILVDAGLPNTEHKVQRALSKLGKRFADICLIIITHAHVDHAGNASQLRRLTGAPICAHADDLPYYRRERAMSFCSTGWFGRCFKKTGAIQAPYIAFEPDILLVGEQVFDLSSFGVQGVVFATKGHTEGSLSVVLGDAAIVGDLVSSGVLLGGICCSHKAKRPPFEDNPSLVALQLDRLLKMGVKTFYMGHGGPLPHDEVARHVESLERIAG